MLLDKLGKIKVTDFGSDDRRELTDLLWDCPTMFRKASREQIIKDLPKEMRILRLSDDQNDKQDIRGIVNNCLEYTGGLRELILIISDAEKSSMPFREVEKYLERFLLKVHIIDSDLNAEEQIQQLASLLMAIESISSDADLRMAYQASAPYLDYSENPWRCLSGWGRADIIDRVLHLLNVAPVSAIGPGVAPLLIFVERIACYVQNEQKKQKLREWTDIWGSNELVPSWQTKAESISILRKHLAEEVHPQAQPVEPFFSSLMIQLESLDSRESSLFAAKAWFKYGQEATDCRNLEVPSDYHVCDHTTILELLDEIWLSEGLETISTIEFFLPRGLFHLKVDEWKLPSEQGKSLGVLYQVILRSSERLMKPFSRAKDDWELKWKRSKNFKLGNDTIKWLSDIKEYDGKHLYYKLRNKKTAALYFLVCPSTIDPDDKRGVFFHMLELGIPIAIWPKESFNGHNLKMLKALFSKKRLPDLPKIIFEQRLKAAEMLRDAELCGVSAEEIHHPGRYFTLFWDDPTRLPFEYMQKFQDIGLRR